MGCDSWAHTLTVHMRTHSHTHMHVCHCGGETVKYSTYLSISTISVTSITPQVAAESKQKQRKGKRIQNRHLNMDGKVLIYHSVSQVSNKKEQNIHAASLMKGGNDISPFHICKYWVLSNCETRTVHVGSCGPMCKHTDYSLEHLRLKSRRRSKILIQPCVRHKCTVWPSEPAAHWLAACEAGNRPSREDPQRSVPLLTWRRWDPLFIAGAFDVTKLASIRPHLNEFKWCDWTGAARETRPQQVMKRACVWECVCASVSALLG